MFAGQPGCQPSAAADRDLCAAAKRVGDELQEAMAAQPSTKVVYDWRVWLYELTHGIGAREGRQ
jgi:hypothetical protein